jgi:hypothetical protein
MGLAAIESISPVDRLTAGKMKPAVRALYAVDRLGPVWLLLYPFLSDEMANDEVESPQRQAEE